MVLSRRAFTYSALQCSLAAGLPVPLAHAASFGRSGAASTLRRSDPESQGVSTRGILDFLDAARAARSELHSFMLLRHGAVVAEAWWRPYRRDAVHDLYSLSKSFTSTAVGFAVAEGRLRTRDPVVGFFPRETPDPVGANLAAMTVEHLLTMSTGQSGPGWEDIDKGRDWVRAFLRIPVVDAPGTVFRYDSGASYMLSAIVQQLTGQTLFDYLTPRLFVPLGLSARWEQCPMGRNLGSSGLSATTETVAKLGQLYLQRGRWNGRQLLPARWIDDATAEHIAAPLSWGPAAWGVLEGVDPQRDPEGAARRVREGSDYYQGYGYQFWRTRHNGYRALGFMGQYAIVLPDVDAVVAITSETDDVTDLLADLVWQHLLPAMHAQPLAPQPAAVARLRAELADPMLALPPGAPSSPIAARCSGWTFRLEPNALGAERVSLTFEARQATFALDVAGTRHAVPCGIDRWIDGVTSLPGTPPGLPALHPAPSRIAGSGAWTDSTTFEMVWRYTEMPHHDTVTCTFTDDGITVRFMNSIAGFFTQHTASLGEHRPVLRGMLEPRN